MPPEPVPVVRLRAAVVVVVLRCFRLLPPALVRGEPNLLGERVPLPTDVELAGAGYIFTNQIGRKSLKIINTILSLFRSARLEFSSPFSVLFRLDETQQGNDKIANSDYLSACGEAIK